MKAEFEDERLFRRRRLGKANGLVVLGVRLYMAWRSVQRAFNGLFFGAGRWQMVMEV